MNPFLVSPEERITLWRNLRNNINGLPLENQLTIIDNWWLLAPFSTWLIDLEFFEKQHSPWELLHDNSWTPASILFMKEQSLLLCNQTNIFQIEIAYIFDISSATDLLIMIIDDKYVMNYSLGEVIDFKNILPQIKILRKYRWNGLRHILS